VLEDAWGTVPLRCGRGNTASAGLCEDATTTVGKH